MDTKTPSHIDEAIKRQTPPCVLCGRPATRHFSPDLDIRGICSCTDHVDEVRLLYHVLIMQGINEFKRMLEQTQKDYRKKLLVSQNKKNEEKRLAQQSKQKSTKPTDR